MATQNSSNIKDKGIVYCDGAGAFAGNNLQADTNTISSTDTNGDVILAPNGTGGVVATTSITAGETSKDVDFTVNGAAITATVALHTSGATDLGGFVSERHSSVAAFGAHSLFLRTKGVEGAPTVVADNDAISRMVSCGYDGTDYAQCAEIRVEVDGTPGADDMPGRILLLTSADGGQTPAEAIRVTSEQKVGINTTAPIDTLHVTGTQRITHTATESDDHALEIDCDAAGFGDVKALDIDYTTGTMAAGQDEEAIFVNIDESASTGGIMAGYLVLSTAEGSATINGYETGINVNPIVHESGTFGDADNILNKAVDVTAALANGGAGNISIFVADNDTFTIGDAATWDEMEIILGTGASGSGVAPTFEYSTGGAAYSSFSPADGTNGFRNTGAILWDSSTLAGWATATSGDFEIRITRTRNTVTTTPIIDELQISSTTEYKWDKDGALNVASLTLTTPLAVASGGTGAATLTGVLTGNGTSAVTANAVTQYGTVIAGAANAVTSVAPSATSGVPLISQGAAANPAYGTAVVAGGGTGATTLTDGGILLGSGTAAVTATAQPGDGQLLVGQGSADPNLLTAWMQQGNNCFFWNLSFTHSAGTLTLAGSDGTALSTSNPGYVIMPSNATQGRMVLHEIVANDTLTVSDLTGNLFGTTTAIAWGSSLPMYIGFMADSADANLEPIIMRLPHIGVSPASSANIGDPSSATADLETSLFAWNDITEGNYQSMQVGLIGSLTATKAVTTNAWTLDALTDQDGAGRWNDNRVFDMVVGQNGASAGIYYDNNGGTAPTWTTVEFEYTLSRDGNCNIYERSVGDAGGDGSGAVAVSLPAPLAISTSIGNTTLKGLGYCWTVGAGAAGGKDCFTYILTGETHKINFWDVAAGATLKYSYYATGARSLTFRSSYKVDVG